MAGPPPAHPRPARLRALAIPSTNTPAASAAPHTSARPDLAGVGQTPTTPTTPTRSLTTPNGVDSSQSQQLSTDRPPTLATRTPRCACPTNYWRKISSTRRSPCCAPPPTPPTRTPRSGWPTYFPRTASLMKRSRCCAPAPTQPTKRRAPVGLLARQGRIDELRARRRQRLGRRPPASRSACEARP